MSALTLPTFNPLTFANRLKEAGVPPVQAEAEAEALHEALAQQAQALSALEQRFNTQETLSKKDAEQAATKGDVRELELLLRKDIDSVRKDVDLVRKDVEALENRLIIKLSAVMVALIGFAGAVLAVVNKL